MEFSTPCCFSLKLLRYFAPFITGDTKVATNLISFPFTSLPSPLSLFCPLAFPSLFLPFPSLLDVLHEQLDSIPPLQGEGER